LAKLGFEQLSGLRRIEPLWLNAAVEGTRLRGWTAKELVSTVEQFQLDSLSRSLVLAQGALNSGEASAAQKLLAQNSGPVRLEAAWILARLWRRAGDPARARMALVRTDGVIGPEMRLLTDYWIMWDEPELQEKQFALILNRAFAPPTTPMLIPVLVDLALG